MSFILMFALQCLFPIFDSNPPELTGVSVVNNDTQAREFTISAASPEGVPSGSGRLTLNPGAQRALLLKEILEAAPSSGSVRIDSAAPGCASLLTSQTEEILTVVEPVGVPSSNVMLPHLSVNTGFVELNHTDTQIAIVNPGTAEANVSAQLFGTDGSSRGNISIAVPAGGSRTMRTATAFRTLIPDNTFGGKTFNGYVRLVSDVPIAAWQRVDTPLSASVARGRAPADIASTNTAVVPHFVFGGSYDSFLNAVNAGTTPLTLELTALDDRGQRIAEITRLSLAAGEAKRASIRELFAIVEIAVFPPPAISGYVRIRRADGQPFAIAGDIEIVNSNSGGNGSAMVSPISDTASTTWLLPFEAGSQPYFTGYSIVNANELLTVQTDVQVDVVAADGTVASRSMIQLSPSARVTALVPSGLPNGYLRITSNFPIHVMGSIGTRDLRQLDQIPALR